MKRYTNFNSYNLGKDFYEWFISKWPHPNCIVGQEKILTLMHRDNRCFKSFLKDINYTGHINIRYDNSHAIHKKYYFVNGEFTRYKIYSRDNICIKDDKPQSLKEIEKQLETKIRIKHDENVGRFVSEFSYNEFLDMWISNNGFITLTGKFVRGHINIFDQNPLEFRFYYVHYRNIEFVGIIARAIFFGFNKENKFLVTSEYSYDNTITKPLTADFDINTKHGIYKYSDDPNDQDYVVYNNGKKLWDSKLKEAIPLYKVII